MWIYEGKEFIAPEQNPYEGFVYEIENIIEGKFYIGKKHFWTRRKNNKTKRKVKKESDWKKYYGSSESLAADIERLGTENFKRTILYLCIYKKQMSYLEQKTQWDRNVLLDGKYYNTNIGGKFFVTENKIYEATEKKIISKNDKWKKIKSESMKGDKNIAKRPDIRKKISQKKSGNNHHFYGKKQYEKTGKAIFDSVAVKVTDGQNIWDSQMHYRREHPVPTFLDEKGQRKLSIDNEIFCSVKDAAKKLNMSSSTIIKYLKNGKAIDLNIPRNMPLSYCRYKSLLKKNIIWEIR